MRLLARLAVTALLLTLIWWQIDPQTLLARIANVHWQPLAAVAVVLAAQFVVWVWRWKTIIEDLAGRPASFADVARFSGASLLYGQVLPSSFGGDLVRTAALSRQLGLGQATMSVLVERVSGVVIVVAMVVVLLPLLAWRIGTTSAFLTLAAIALGGLAAFLAWLFAPNRFRLSWFPAAASLAAHLRRALFSRKLAPTVVGCGLLIQLTSVGLVYLLGRAVEVPFAFLDCLLLVPPALLIAAAPISLAGWGVREGALAGGFALVGVPAADVVAVSILYGLTGPAMGLVYGVVALFMPKNGGEPSPGDARPLRKRD